MVITEAPLRSFPLVACDTETTGLDHTSNRITEISAVKITEGIRSEFSYLLNPDMMISSEATSVSNITNEMVLGCNRFKDVAKEFLDFIGNSVLVFHNAPFDVAFLAVELQRARLKLPTNIVLDSHRMSTAMMPDSPSHKLRDIHKLIDKKPDSTRVFHRALNDANACLDVSIDCLSKHKLSNKSPVCNVFSWAGSHNQFSYHDINELKTSFATDLDAQSALKARRLSKIKYLRYGRIISVTGIPVAFTRDDKRSKVLVVDIHERPPIGIKFEHLRGIEVLEAK